MKQSKSGIIIGVTGGIGTGKSSVAAILKKKDLILSMRMKFIIG